jgi:hypothetical protein
LLHFLFRRNDSENKLKKERREQLQQREDLQLLLPNLLEPARQVQQQQTAQHRGQYQMTIRVHAVLLPWLARCHSTDTTTNTAARHVCIFIQKCCKMIKKTT